MSEVEAAQGRAAATEIGRGVEANLNLVVLGKPAATRLATVALLADGHLLIEDVPGVGKTLLARTLASAIELTYRRVQLTPDLMPADIVGASVWLPGEGKFEFRGGPVFTNVLVADELNRASPRTQSALLEAMGERQATVDGLTYGLPRPFFVVATQNPIDAEGTYPLPEAQLDRFMLRLELGYPDATHELEMLFGSGGFERLKNRDRLPRRGNADALVAAQRAVQTVQVRPAVGRYVVDLVRATRSHPDALLGVSPRGAQALFRAAQAFALLDGRDYARPEDVQALAGRALAHRITLRAPSSSGRDALAFIEEVVRRTPVPM